MVVRILIWNLFDSDMTIAELRETVPELDQPDTWLWSEANERFGAVTFDEVVPPALERARELVGREPDVYEEFDAV
ncbi:MAG: hypothetical protein ACRELC_10800 [Gemmatimonadota bacterium]